MEHVLREIYDFYRNGERYAANSMDLDLQWLEGKLDKEEIDELMGQIFYHIMENEEDVFCDAFQFAWALFLELDKKKSKAENVINKMTALLEEG